MELNKINFSDANAQKVYENYLLQIKLATKQLVAKDQKDILMELNSHIFESMQINKLQDELANLLNTIEKIGVPIEVLKPLIADKILEKATQTFHPIDVFRALMLNISNGLIYVLFSILYLFMFTFVFLIVTKVMYPEHTGMFYKKNEFFSFGLIPLDQNRIENEILGNWFIPVTILLAVLFYAFITLLLRLKTYYNKNKNLSLT